MILEIEIQDETYERVKKIAVDLGDNIFGDLVRAVQKGREIEMADLPFIVSADKPFEK